MICRLFRLPQNGQGAALCWGTLLSRGCTLGNVLCCIVLKHVSAGVISCEIGPHEHCKDLTGSSQLKMSRCKFGPPDSGGIVPRVTQ